MNELNEARSCNAKRTRISNSVVQQLCEVNLTADEVVHGVTRLKVSKE